MSCGGSKTQLCGGGNRLSTYALSNWTAPTIPKTVGFYTYAGCYTEATNKRALGSAKKVDYASMTVEICAEFCKSYSMFGLEYSGEVRLSIHRYFTWLLLNLLLIDQ